MDVRNLMTLDQVRYIPETSGKRRKAARGEGGGRSENWLVVEDEFVVNSGGWRPGRWKELRVSTAGG